VGVGRVTLGLEQYVSCMFHVCSESWNCLSQNFQDKRRGLSESQRTRKAQKEEGNSEDACISFVRILLGAENTEKTEVIYCIFRSYLQVWRMGRIDMSFVLRVLRAFHNSDKMKSGKQAILHERLR